MSPKKVFPNARRMGIEIHKFGGASLADAAAFRRVVEIVKTRTAPRIVVVSAPAGVTDTLLELAKRAAAGDGESGAKEIDDLGTRYLGILRGAAARGHQGGRGRDRPFHGRARPAALQPGGAQGADRRGPATSSSAAASASRRGCWRRR